MKAGLAAVLVLAASPLLAQPQDFSKVEIAAEMVADGISMVTGSGTGLAYDSLK